MIKNAKAGDVIFELKYDERDKAGDITERVVSLDHKIGDYIWTNGDILVHPYDAFKTHKQAYNTYIRYLKRDLARANKTVALITDILSKVDKPKRKKSQPPYLGDPVWESKNEMSMSLLTIVDHLPE